MKKAKSSVFLVELLIWQKKQKCAYEPAGREERISGQRTRRSRGRRLSEGGTDGASSIRWP